MRDVPDDPLRLEHQVCFRLYGASRLITRLYQPLLEPVGLTYPQYIVLMILWQDAPCAVSHVGKRALLNTNTLTPLLKRLESLGLIRRKRTVRDERVVELHLTDDGIALRKRCTGVPIELAEILCLPQDKFNELTVILDLLLSKIPK
jgi:DNA-binding MarR family transcriptional regulator